MLFTIKTINNISGNLKIVKNKKYGVINNSNHSYIISAEYDNIICCGMDIFILYKNGKIGLYRIEENYAVTICECEYDVIDNFNNNLFLSNDKTTVYYHSITKQRQKFKEVIIDMPYIYGYDEEYQYIIHSETGETIYRKQYGKYNKSYYMYCGFTDKGAVFYDTVFSAYLYPSDKGYAYYQYPINCPVIINKNNVINIVDGENGIGVIDSFGNSIIDDKYDEILLELKITAANQTERKEKFISVPNGVYNKAAIFQPDKW